VAWVLLDCSKSSEETCQLDLNFTADEQAFRVEVRGWLNHTLPYDLSERVRLGKRLGKFVIELWHSLLNERGGLVTVQFRSLSSTICYEGDMEWQRDTQTSFALMRCGSPRRVD
jgi:hypothetical protein